MVTIEILKARIARAQTELAAVTAELEELTRSPGGSSSDLLPQTSEPDGLGTTVFSDPRSALTELDTAFARMGIDVTRPSLTPEAVQELMRGEGVRPEDLIVSGGIAEAREE
jgi:hypothetical protein